MTHIFSMFLYGVATGCYLGWLAFGGGPEYLAACPLFVIAGVAVELRGKIK
jgi:hypothetical protein